jgi:hypothetical protein
MDRFSGVERTVSWMHRIELGDWNPGDVWKLDCLLPEQLKEMMSSMDVLGDYYWMTSLRDQEWVELSCLDLALTALTTIYRGHHELFNIPSHLLRYPEYDRDSLRDQGPWSRLQAALDRNLWESDRSDGRVDAVPSKRKLWFFSVVHYDSDHWCAIAVDFAEFSVTFFDPQQPLCCLAELH